MWIFSLTEDPTAPAPHDRRRLSASFPVFEPAGGSGYPGAAQVGTACGPAMIENSITHRPGSPPTARPPE